MSSHSPVIHQLCEHYELWRYHIRNRLELLRRDAYVGGRLPESKHDEPSPLPRARGKGLASQSSLPHTRNSSNGFLRSSHVQPPLWPTKRPSLPPPTWHAWRWGPVARPPPPASSPPRPPGQDKPLRDLRLVQLRVLDSHAHLYVLQGVRDCQYRPIAYSFPRQSLEHLIEIPRVSFHFVFVKITPFLVHEIGIRAVHRRPTHPESLLDDLLHHGP